MESMYFDRRIETTSRGDLTAHQTLRLQLLLKELLGSNSFYGRKLRESGFTDSQMLHSLDDVRRLPFTCKDELVEDQEGHPPFGTNLTYPLDRYIHLHQTSGTMGKPLRWLDTMESWDWWARCWGAVYRGAPPA
jgi:phenylacetate-CoA ligase